MSMAFEHIMHACQTWQKRILQRTSPIASTIAILSKIWRILRGGRYRYNSASCTKPIDRCLEVHGGVDFGKKRYVTAKTHTRFKVGGIFRNA